MYPIKGLIEKLIDLAHTIPGPYNNTKRLYEVKQGLLIVDFNWHFLFISPSQFELIHIKFDSKK